MKPDPVARGLAQNPAVPVGVLVRLLRDRPEPVAAGLRDRTDLPLQLQQEMAGHQSRRVRSALAASAHLDPAVRDRLLDDPDWRVRAWDFAWRKQQPPLPDRALSRLMTDLLDPPPDMDVLDHELFAELFAADGDRVAVAVRHPDPRVRRLAVTSASAGDLRSLADDPDPAVAAAATARITENARLMEPADLPQQHCHALWAVLQRPLSRALAEQVAASGDVDVVQFFAGNPTIPADVVASLSRHPATVVRARIAGRADLTAGQVGALASDPDPAVRVVIATRAGLTGRQIAALAADPDDDVRATVATHAYVRDDERAILDGHDRLSPDLAPRWARSTNPRLRRRAAQHPDLPAELVTVLAADPDATVRAALARHHPGAPADLLLSCYLEDRHRSALLTLPQFPRTGLARLAGHADPHVRLLAARDPDADPAVIARLAGDPHLCVRRAMARCPRLPADRLTALLDDPELATDAAANPAADWRGLLDRLG